MFLFRFCNAPRGAVQLGLVIEATTSDRAPSYQIDNFYKPSSEMFLSDVPYFGS